MTSRRFVQSEKAHLLAKGTTFLSPLRSSPSPFRISPPSYSASHAHTIQMQDARCQKGIQVSSVYILSPSNFTPLSLAMYSIARLLLDEWHLRGDTLGFMENTVDCIINTYRKIPVTTATASNPRPWLPSCDKVLKPTISSSDNCPCAALPSTNYCKRETRDDVLATLSTYDDEERKSQFSESRYYVQ
jgi:hypothetical protein